MQPSGVRPIPAVHRSLSRGVPVDKELGIRDKGIGELESGVNPPTVGLCFAPFMYIYIYIYTYIYTYIYIKIYMGLKVDGLGARVPSQARARSRAPLSTEEGTT